MRTQITATDWDILPDTHGDLHSWTWAGYRVNATLQASLAGVADPVARESDLFIRLCPDLRASSWPSLVRAVSRRLVLPAIDEKALAGLKFNAALPRQLAVATLAGRLADFEHAAGVLPRRPASSADGIIRALPTASGSSGR